MKQCKCGSFALNLWREGIDQGDLCDRHYWQDRAEKAEARTLDARIETLIAAFKAERGGLVSERDEAREDAARVDWLETAFVKSWNGAIDGGSVTYWRLAGDYRHKFQHMNGATFRDAIDAAIAEVTL